MRLKDLREDRDETQRQMAALLNVGQSTYSMYENGQREIPLAAENTLLCSTVYYTRKCGICKDDYLPGASLRPTR